MDTLHSQYLTIKGMIEGKTVQKNKVSVYQPEWNMEMTRHTRRNFQKYKVPVYQSEQ